MVNRNTRTTLSKWRLRARFIFRVSLVVGFFYQSWLFLEMYLKYPAIVELDVSEPAMMELPAVTICNNNEIRASAYCTRYPHHCSSPDKDPNFCNVYEIYCKQIKNRTKEVPMVRISSYLNLSRFEQQELGHTFERFVKECTIETEDGKANCKDPIKFPARSFSDLVPFNCYMINSLYKKPNASPLMTTNTAKIHLVLDLESSEFHPSHLSRGAQLSLHTPYHVPSPVADGYFLNLGYIYRLSIKMSDKNLLSKPYKSNCTDYIKQWKANGGDGPVTERMCKEKCKLDVSLALYNCVDYSIDYPHNLTICPHAMSGFLPIARNRCGNQCSSPCKIRQYDVHLSQADSEGSRTFCFDNSDISCLIIIHISFENWEVTTFTYKPSFEPIGILSFIGGYVGLWLGISLLTVYDFIETRLFRIILFIRKKFRKTKKQKITPMSSSRYNSFRFNRQFQISSKSKHRTHYIR